jgi:T5orf172 domain.
MNYEEAAIEAFRLSNNEAKTAKELWQIIESEGLKESSGKTPWATLRTVLTRHSDNPYESRPERNGEVFFDRLTEESPDKFKLIEKQNENLNTVEKCIENEKENQFVTEVTSSKIDWQKVIVKNNNGNLEYHTENCVQYTYFITGQHKEKVKIGKTRQTPEDRLKSMSTGHPDLNIAIAVPASKLSESQAHKKFDNERHRDEWFFRTKRIRNYIKRQKQLTENVIERYRYEQKMKELDAKVLEIA